MQTRTCSLCITDKPTSQFARSGIAKDGLHTWCKACKASRAREWYAANQERLRAADRKLYAADGTRQREQARRWYAANKSRSFHSKRNWKLRQYGLTPADYEAMLAAQDGRCAICRKEPDGIRQNDLAVDHCHETLEVRGLLCHQCNVGLGHFADSVELLQAATAYLSLSLLRRSA